MKGFCKAMLWIIIILSAAVSVHYAAELYRTKYAPRYLKGNAC